MACQAEGRRCSHSPARTRPPTGATPSSRARALRHAELMTRLPFRKEALRRGEPGPAAAAAGRADAQALRVPARAASSSARSPWRRWRRRAGRLRAQGAEFLPPSSKRRRRRAARASPDLRVARAEAALEARLKREHVEQRWPRKRAARKALAESANKCDVAEARVEPSPRAMLPRRL